MITMTTATRTVGRFPSPSSSLFPFLFACLLFLFLLFILPFLSLLHLFSFLSVFLLSALSFPFQSACELSVIPPAHLAFSLFFVLFLLSHFLLSSPVQSKCTLSNYTSQSSSASAHRPEILESLMREDEQWFEVPGSERQVCLCSLLLLSFCATLSPTTACLLSGLPSSPLMREDERMKFFCFPS